MGFGLSAQAAETAKPSKQMEQFFSWSKESQESHIGNSILMIGVIASQTAPNIARCIDTWYFTSKALKAKRKAETITVMKKLPQYTPEAIILAVVEKACGKFKRAAR